MEELFEDYCKRKKIDPIKFKQGDPEKYKEWQLVFDQIHPDSFTAQKLYLINDIRRRYHYDVIVEKVKTATQATEKPIQTTSVSTPPKPAIGKPKIPTANTGEANDASKPKPVIGKPKIPVKKTTTEESNTIALHEENKPVSKPKPVIPGMKKPVIPSKEKSEDTSEETTKPKAVIPKPKIPAKPATTDTTNEEPTSTTPPRPKPKLAVKIPPKKKE